MMNFLFGRMFYTDLWLAGLFIAFKLPKRDKFPLRLLGTLLGLIAFSYGWAEIFSRLPVWNPLLLSVVNHLIPFGAVLGALCLCFYLHGWSIPFVGAAMWFIQHLSSDIDALIFPKNGLNFPSYLRHLMVLLAVCAVFYFFLFRRLDSHTLRYLDLSAVVPIWVVMCLVCLILSVYANSTGEDCVSFRLMDTLCTAMGLLYQRSMYYFCGLQRQRDGVQKLLRESEEQYEAAKRNTELINIKCHDLRLMIRHFQQQGRVDDGIFEELEQAVREYDSEIHTGNSALDVILTEKSIQCAAEGIGFTCMAEASGLGYIAPVDLYVLFGNALENAIEACRKLTEPDKKQISLSIYRAGGFYAAQLQNYTEREIEMVGDTPVTDKEDKKNHGFGIKSMRLLAEKYDGELHFRQEGDVVELYLLLPCREEAKN